MKNILVLYFIMYIFSVSCSTPETKIPENILDKEKMTMLMCDMLLAEATVKLLINKVDSTSIHTDTLFQSVFKKHNISSKEFDENFSYYSSQPMLMETIYNKAIEFLSEQQAGLKGEISRSDEEK